ncbi:hypothetical protein [uncultured Campylobacter sp.]|uniref:hypothetical protein n=1 Tax=uncultured Campylobacter sp. TaxID=218934 RepID=UPI00261A1425|nr:hypothetical protein [uncultured Campylobacter sp.]
MATNDGLRKSVNFNRVNLKIAAVKFSPPKFYFAYFRHSRICTHKRLMIAAKILRSKISRLKILSVNFKNSTKDTTPPFRLS